MLDALLNNVLFLKLCALLNSYNSAYTVEHVYYLQIGYPEMAPGQKCWTGSHYCLSADSERSKKISKDHAFQIGLKCGFFQIKKIVPTVHGSFQKFKCR